MCLLEDVRRAVSRGGQEKAVKVRYHKARIQRQGRVPIKINLKCDKLTDDVMFSM